MKTIFVGTHSIWKVSSKGYSKAEVAEKMGADVEDIDFVEYSEVEYILKDVPTEFRSVLSYMAYERGHSAGEDEVVLHLKELVSNLKPAIDAYTIRLSKH